MEIWLVLNILKKLSVGWFLKDLKDFAYFFYVFFFCFFLCFFAENYIRIESTWFHQIWGTDQRVVELCRSVIQTWLTRRWKAHAYPIWKIYITPEANQGGLLRLPLFRTFFLKNRFLSDYVVPACPKYISGKLRSFSKNFSKNFFHTTLFENFLPTDASVANAKNQPSQGLGTPQNCLCIIGFLGTPPFID